MFIFTIDELTDLVEECKNSKSSDAAVKAFIEKNGLKSLHIQEGMTEPDQLTQGQTLVGLNFNPSGDPRVDQAKRHAAAMYDLVVKLDGNKESELKRSIRLHTAGEILNAQMCVVKLITFNK